MIALRLAEESAYASAEIGIGAQDRLTWVPVDDEITRWLNTIDDSDESLPPVPNPDAWHWFRMPSAGASVVFETGIETTFDVLEIISYPDGLDDAGVPISTDGVQIPLTVIERAIGETEYYAIGGIMLPIGDSHPDSFMVLMRNESARDSR